MKLSILGFTKIAIPALLVLLGVNGLIEVHLQRDMAAKSVQLTSHVSEAKALSAQLKGGLTGLTTLKSETDRMQTSLVSVQRAARNMADGLETLSTTVAGINASVGAIQGGVKTTKTEIREISGSEAQILSTLQQLGSINGDMVHHLQTMIADEEQINQDLTEMNRKTALVP